MIIWSDLTTGERLKWLRGEMTQEALAEATGLSVWTIRNIEQDRAGRSASLATLMRLATALGTDVAVLMGQRSPSRADNRLERQALQAIRSAVNTPDTFVDVPGVVGGEPVSLAEVRGSFERTAHEFWAGDFAAVGGMTPTLIRDAKNAAAISDGEVQADAYGILGAIYELTARLAVMFGDHDLAFSAVRSALSAAGRSSDSLLAHAAVITLATTYVRKGEYRHAEQVATLSAEQIVPHFGKGTPLAQFSVWGNLMILAAVAASRNERPDESREYMGMAHAAAQRLGEDRMDYHMHFGPTVATMEGAGVAIRTGDVGRALNLTDSIHDTEALRPVAKANYLLNAAYANMLARRDNNSSDILAEIHRDSPDWLRHQPLAVNIIETLYERERSSSVVRKLARAVGIVQR